MNKDNNKNQYKPQEIEPKWQKKWQEDKTYQPDLKSAKKPFYNLMMFPYPSAEGLHVGNMYAFTGSDIYGRYKRMQGYDVFEPMGLDGFGIHSENYALKVGTHPKEQAKKSEENFYRQLASIGNGFAWDNRLETYDPEYYKWTQWVFVQLFKAGLAYRKKAPVNFCPSCKTVLADEQVIPKVSRVPQVSKVSQGENQEAPRDTRGTLDTRDTSERSEVTLQVCERCSSVVEKRDLEQWFFRITNYADRLLKNLDTINWAEKVKVAQKQWIGKSEGAEIAFRLQSTDYSETQSDNRPQSTAVDRKLNAESRSVDRRQKAVDTIRVFTSRPDTIFGVTFLVLAPEHPYVAQLVTEEQKSNVAQYIEAVKAKSDIERTDVLREKTGVFTGSYAINPVNEAKIPIWIADYVLSSYGTGAVMGVPGSDHRDFEFAKKYALPVVKVIENNSEGIVEGRSVILNDSEESPTNVGSDKPRDPSQAQDDKIVVTHGVLVNSGQFNGLAAPIDAIPEIIKFLEEKNAGRPVKQFHLRDWLISRQRYWGPPIPMIYCPSCASAGKSYFSTRSGEAPNQPQNEAGKSITGTTGTTSTTGKDQPETPRDTLDTRDTFDTSWNSAGWYPVPDDQLPVVLPDVEDWKPLGSGSSPLAAHPEFYEVKCPQCGSDARRETDVSDTFLDSAWYFLRYLFTDYNDIPFGSNKFTNTSTDDSLPTTDDANSQQSTDYSSSVDRKPKAESRSVDRRPKAVDVAARWLPVHMYIGGAEHSVLHLLYSRFVTMVFKDLGILDFEEPFTRFYAHGLIIKDGAKMSKSKGNVVVPDEYISKYGADTLRSYLMFTGPYNMGGDFRDSGVEGMNRFIRRVWTLVTSASITDSEELFSYFHKLIQESTEDMENLRYNTAIAKLMMYYNELSKKKEVTKGEIKAFLKLAAPFMPHLTEELWEMIGEKGSIHVSDWPTYDESLLESNTATIAVQINGKLRSTLEVQSENLKAQNEIEELASKDSNVAKHLEGKQIKKVIYVPGKILNFVV